MIFRIRLVVKAVGSWQIDSNDLTVREIEVKPGANVWALNQSTHIREWGTCIHPMDE